MFWFRLNLVVRFILLVRRTRHEKCWQKHADKENWKFTGLATAHRYCVSWLFLDNISFPFPLPFPITSYFRAHARPFRYTESITLGASKLKTKGLKMSFLSLIRVTALVSGWRIPNTIWRRNQSQRRRRMKEWRWFALRIFTQFDCRTTLTVKNIQARAHNNHNTLASRHDGHSFSIISFFAARISVHSFQIRL